jgi:hypothetical protein
VCGVIFFDALAQFVAGKVALSIAAHFQPNFLFGESCRKVICRKAAPSVAQFLIDALAQFLEGRVASTTAHFPASFFLGNIAEKLSKED